MKNKLRRFFSFLSRHKVGTRVLSMTLSLVMLFYVIPTVVYAEIADAFSSEEQAAESGVVTDSVQNGGLNSNSVSYPIYEVDELREDNVKHFRLSDGSYIAAQYDSAVHYRDEAGLWQDIDNVMYDGGNEEFVNSDSRIKFAKKINGSGKILSLKNGDFAIDISVVGGVKGAVGEVTNFTDSEDDTELQKMLNLEKLSSSVKYPGIFSGADIEFLNHSYNVENKITVNEKCNGYTYSFELKLKGLNASVTNGGDIVLSSAESGEIIYTLPAPLATDANGNYAPGGTVGYTLASDGKKYTLSVNINADWMNNAARAFPIEISSEYVSETNEDGGYEIGRVSSSSLDITYIKINSLPEIPDSAYLSDVLLTLSEEVPNTAYGIYEVTSDWSSESLSYETYLSGEGRIADGITDANSESYTFNITELANKWNEDPESNFGVAIMAIGDDSGNTENNTAPMAYAMRSVATPTVSVNYSNMEGVEDYFSYTSQSIGAAGNVSVNNATGHLTLAIPTLSNYNEVMPYTLTPIYNSYLSGKAHTSANTDVPFVEQIMPCGFKMNVSETVVAKSYYENGQTKTYYLLEDSDGTTHAFFETSTAGKYTDSDGLQKTMTVTNATISITDDSRITREYDKVSNVTGAWCLTRIMDSFGNVISVSKDATGMEPERLNFSSGGRSGSRIRILSVTGTSIYGFFNETTKEFAIFRHSETYNGAIGFVTNRNYLRQIEFGIGTDSTSAGSLYQYYYNSANNSGLTIQRTVNYEYNSSGQLIKAEDATLGQSVLYTWDNSGRVTKASHYAGAILGQEVSFTYGTGYTDVRTTGNDEILNTADDIITRYTFDENGRSVSVYSYSAAYNEIYGATVGKYEAQENVKNNLKEQTVTGGSSVNYLLNGDFELRTARNVFSHWTLSSGIVEYSPSGLNTYGYYALRIKPAIGNTAYIEQTVFLKAGEYTLSMPVYSQNGEEHAAFAEISSISNSGLNQTNEIALNPNSYTGMRSWFATTFTVPSYTNGGDNVKIRIRLTSNSTASQQALFAIDDISLTKGISSADYSYVKYGTFDVSGINSSGAVSTTLQSQWKTQANATPTIVDGGSPFGNAVKVSANNSSSYVKHRVYEIDQEHLDTYDYNYSMFSKNVGAQFIVSGFAKAVDASLSEYATLQLKVDIVYYQGAGEADVVKTYTYEFLPTADDWQFVCGSLDTDYKRVTGSVASDGNSYYCIKAIDIYCDYSNQASGYALFDNISVVNATDYSIQKYYYYTNGLVARTEGLTYNEYYYYDENRNVIISANNRGEVTYYFYEHETNPYVVTSSVDCDFTYNGTYDYPHRNGDSFDGLSETAKTRTDYTYEEHGLCILTKTYEATLGTDGEFYKKSGSKELTQSYSYVTYDSSNYSLEKTCFGAVLTLTDSLGVTTRNFYDVTKGRLLATVNESTGEGLAYTYDSIGNLAGVTPATFVSSSQYNSATNAESVNYTYNNQNLLSSITTESTVYTLTYDAFGNSSSVKAGDKTLATYEYNNNNGKLTKINYGNGFSVEYVHNRLEMLTEIWYNENGTRTLAYEYAYTDDGQVYKFKDNLSNRTLVYRYDNVGKLVSFAEYGNDDLYNDFSAEMFYDQNTNELSSISYRLNYASATPKTTNPVAYYYYRNADGVIYKNTISTKATSGREEFTYDGYDRLIGKQAYFSVSNNTSHYFDNDTTYTYKSDALTGYNTSALVEKYTSYVNNSLSFENAYSYDSNGNIAKIRYNDGTEIRYVYDDIGQLIREDNGKLNKTYLYEYDNAGNITAVKTCNLTAAGTTPTPTSTKTYTYSSGSWGDLLTGYNGATITYDNIGNPLSYNNGSAYNFTWSGRQLVGAVYNSNTYSFTYNENGYRTSKTKNGVTTTYFLNSSQIMAEETSGNMTVYLYDVNGSPVGMQYHATTAGEYEWQVFWYEKNLQGDIVAVYNDSGVKLVSYNYDAWGNFTTSYHNGGVSTKATDNPFTYRGYYYDKDLDLYRLGTRYYDSNIGRFINSDSIIDISHLNGLNLYSYCGNDPINRYDPTGYFFDYIFDAVFVALGIVDFVEDPSWAKGALLAVDIALAVIPFIPALSGARHLNKVDDVVDASKALNTFDDLNDVNVTIKTGTKTINNDIVNLPRTGSALKNDPHHAFPDVVDNYAGYATKTSIENGTLYQLQGTLNGKAGRFEWIVQNQQVTHRFFVEGGGINGIPNRP